MYTSNYVALFVLLLITSEVASTGLVFFTRTPQTVVNDEFKMCFESDHQDCLDLSRPQYEFYIRSNLALSNNEDVPEMHEDHTGLRATVDSFMFEFLNGDELDELNCIPHVSSYTDCTRENICTGCQSCSCDETGSWNCTHIMRCTPEPKLVVDGTVLQTVMDNLNQGEDYNSDRMKRDVKPQSIDYNHLFNWLEDKERRKNSNYKADIHSRSINEKYNNFDPLPFNEILSFIKNEENNKRRKALDNNIEGKQDDNDKITPQKQDVTNYLNMVDDTAMNSDETASNVIIDLLESSNKSNKDKNEEGKLVKRNVPVTATSEFEVSDSIKKLKEDILYPLTSVIDSKQKEIDELLKIRKKLIRFLMVHNSLNTDNVTKTEATTESPYVSIYKIEVLPEASDMESELKIANSSITVEKYFGKLKRDIYEVIKDIVGIQKYSNTKTLPQDLRVLIRAMRYYVRHQDELLFSGNKIGGKGIVPTKKEIQISLRDKGVDLTYIKENLNKILKAVQDTPIPDAISNLSADTHKIVKRIIKENYNVEYGNNFNLTIDIKDIGSLWNPIMKDAEGSSALEKLNYMKLLYIVLISDMNKVNHAMHILEFAKNRRMTIDGHLVPFVAKRINVALSKIQGKLDEMIDQSEKPTESLSHFHEPSALHPKIRNSRLIKIHGYSEKNPLRKESMLRHIKDMLKTSKHEIVNLIRRKVPKSEIIKTIAKKKFGMLSKEQHIQNVMETWQKNLNVSSLRDKRSVTKKIKKQTAKKKKQIKKKPIKAQKNTSKKKRNTSKKKYVPQKKKKITKKPQQKKINNTPKKKNMKTLVPYFQGFSLMNRMKNLNNSKNTYVPNKNAVDIKYESSAPKQYFFTNRPYPIKPNFSNLLTEEATDEPDSHEDYLEIPDKEISSLQLK